MSIVAEQEREVQNLLPPWFDSLEHEFQSHVKVQGCELAQIETN